jgi:hypothetical protein
VATIASSAAATIGAAATAFIANSRFWGWGFSPEKALQTAQNQGTPRANAGAALPAACLEMKQIRQSEAELAPLHDDLIFIYYYHYVASIA